MSNLPRRMWSILLTCAMLLTLLPVTALAVTGANTFEAVKTNLEAGTNVKLTGDISQLETAGCIHITSAVTLDLNGYSLEVLANGSCSEDGGNATHFIRVAEGGTLTVIDSSEAESGSISTTYQANSSAYTVEVLSGGSLVLNKGTLTNENTINRGGAVVYLRSGSSFTMTSGSVTAMASTVSTQRVYSLWINSGATAAISGGVVSGGASLSNSGTLTMTGGQVDADPVALEASFGSGIPVYDGTNTTVAQDAPDTFAASLTRDGVTYYYTADSDAADQVLKAAASGDVLELRQAVTASKQLALGSTLTIKCAEGIDQPTITAANYCAIQTATGEDGAVTYTAVVTEESGIAKAENAQGEVSYSNTLGNALKAAGDGGKVTLLQDVTSSSSQVVRYSVTLDLNGHTITGTTTSSGYAALYVDQANTLTIVDSSANQTGAVTNTKGENVLLVKNEDAVINVEGGTFTGTLSQSTGKLVITGGTFNSDVEQFVPTGYQCADNENGTYTVSIIDNQLVVGGKVDTSSGTTTVSGTLGGAFETSTEITGGVDGTNGSETGVEDNAITVDLTTDGTSAKADTTTLTVQAETAATLDGADSLTIVSDAGTVELPQEAMAKISAAGDTGSPVTIKVVQDDASYSVSVTDASGANLLPNTAADNGTITISVPYTLPAGKMGVLVFCVDEGSHGRMESKLEDRKLTWTTSHLSTFQGVEYDGNDEVVYITNSSAAAGTLADALNAVKDAGGTIYLLKNVELQNASYLITGAVTVKSAGVYQTTPVIRATVPASSKCFTVYHPGALVLEDIQLVIEKAQDATATYGIDVYHGATLTLNNAAVELKNLSNATISSDDTQGQQKPGVFQLNGSTITATDIGGNFSNGGDWKLTNNSEITITGCTSHGLSCDSLEADNSELKVTGTGLLGVTAREINLTNDAQITVDGCGTELPKESKWSTDKESYKYPVEIKKGGSVSVDATSTITLQNNKSGDADNNVLYLVESQLDNQGTIDADVTSKAPESFFVVTLEDWDGVIKSESINSGSYTLPEAPTREGYTFTGWSDGENVYQPNEVATIEKDTTFTAQWSQNSTTTGGGGGGGGVTTYAITLPSDVANGAVTASSKTASKGATVTLTVTPDEGYVLDKLTVTDASGSAIALTKKSDTQYTFSMPGSKVTVAVSFQEIVEAPANPFTDVEEGSFYYDAVLWAVDSGVTNGTSATTFSPDATLTRAEMVTFLWRAHGSPEATGANPFTDVEAGSFYYDAVLWAVANGITNGTTATTFSPEDPVTRAQAVTFQWRAAGSPAVSGGTFADVPADTWFTGAVAWAVEGGITLGTGGNYFSPEAPVTRAQAVTFLYRELA